MHGSTGSRICPSLATLQNRSLARPGLCGTHFNAARCTFSQLLALSPSECQLIASPSAWNKKHLQNRFFFFPIFFNPHDGPDMCPFLSIWSSKKLESTWHIQWHLCCHWPKRLLTDTATEMNKDVAAQCSRKKPLQTTWKRNHFRFNEFNSFNRFNSHHENFKALDPGSKLGKTWQNGKTTFCFALARSPAWFVHGASISGHLLSCVWCTHHLPEPGVHWNLGCQWHLS